MKKEIPSIIGHVFILFVLIFFMYRAYERDGEIHRLISMNKELVGMVREIAKQNEKLYKMLDCHLRGSKEVINGCHWILNKPLIFDKTSQGSGREL